MWLFSLVKTKLSNYLWTEMNLPDGFCTHSHAVICLTFMVKCSSCFPIKSINKPIKLNKLRILSFKF